MDEATTSSIVYTKERRGVNMKRIVNDVTEQGSAPVQDGAVDAIVEGPAVTTNQDASTRECSVRMNNILSTLETAKYYVVSVIDKDSEGAGIRNENEDEIDHQSNDEA